MCARITIEVHFAELAVGVAYMLFFVRKQLIFAVCRSDSLEAVCADRIYC